MSPTSRATPEAVSLSDLPPIQPPQPMMEDGPDHLSPAQRDRSRGEALLWQVPARLSVAIVAALVQLAIVRALPGRGDARLIVVVTLAYLALVGAFAALVRSRGGATPALVTTVLGVDLAYAFTLTGVSTAPTHYERALFGAMVLIHVANFYFGRRQALRVLAMGFVGYVALIWSAQARALPIERVEELWTLGFGLAGTMLIVVQAGHMRRRLRTILTLFERAEQGDFSHTYDEAADQRFDAITRVGRAYNRVRTQLASLVLSDPLTGCLNRRGFEQALAREISRASRAGTELALLVLDLDHFKQVNDTWGHPAGDEVLRATGRLLQETARVGDTVSRVGGEEFAILLPATGADGALHFASRLCDLVRAHPFTVATQVPAIRLTTSVGVAAVSPRNSRDSAGEGAVLARQADIALYAAKRSGRDQARQWGPELEILPRSAGATHAAEDLPLGFA